MDAAKSKTRSMPAAMSSFGNTAKPNVLPVTTSARGTGFVFKITCSHVVRLWQAKEGHDAFALRINDPVSE